MIKTNTQLENMLIKMFNTDVITKVGVLGEASDAKKYRAKGNVIKSNSKVKLVDIATIHEFGTETIPERSFLRSTFDDKKKSWELLVTKLIKNQVKDNKFDPKMVAKQFGNIATGDVKLRFTNNRWDGLSPATIRNRLSKFSPNYRKSVVKKARKRASEGKMVFRPLIDTNQLRGSISFSVEGD